MMVLSKRMQMVADMVTKGNVVADVGCDHGFISIYLIEQNICPKVIAMDVNEGPLLHAKDNIANSGLNSYIDVRLSDGIEKLQEKEADSIIIAGMGGRLVIKILSDQMDKVKELKEIIVQPQSELHLVRNFFAEHGLTIEEEDMVEDSGKYYTVIKAVWREGEPVTFPPAEARYGPILLKNRHPVLYRYLQREKMNFSMIKQQIQSHGKPEEKSNFRHNLFAFATKNVMAQVAEAVSGEGEKPQPERPKETVMEDGIQSRILLVESALAYYS